ncbi:5'-deoxynucleotidase HDDC2 isoform X2 [Bacillus rossius redtenbacheri]|uniref:5'-deoxynucleotidase HDDC2 isoform X2 n=1 Tax=Bacillus rossius redtenbacheri TaxID=93214 RepID=UPI002FDD32A6
MFNHRTLDECKKTPRRGWELRNIQNPESVAGHMYRMAIMTFLLDENDSLDTNRCMKMALIHDLPECIVGDITPYCGVDPAEKKRLEIEAMERLAKLAGTAGTEMSELFKEYVSQSTPEAKFVKQLDRMDMILQAFEYEVQTDGTADLQEFFDRVEDKFSHPSMVSLKKEIAKQREEFHNNASSDKQ